MTTLQKIRTNIEVIAEKAVKGDAQSQFEMGEHYYWNAVASNWKIGMRWYTKAAEQGHAKAQYELGCCYYDTGSVSKEAKEKALHWWTKAAEQGYKRAQHKINKHHKAKEGVSDQFKPSLDGLPSISGSIAEHNSLADYSALQLSALLVDIQKTGGHQSAVDAIKEIAEDGDKDIDCRRILAPGKRGAIDMDEYPTDVLVLLNQHLRNTPRPEFNSVVDEIDDLFVEIANEYVKASSDMSLNLSSQLDSALYEKHVDLIEGMSIDADGIMGEVGADALRGGRDMADAIDKEYEKQFEVIKDRLMDLEKEQTTLDKSKYTFER